MWPRLINAAVTVAGVYAVGLVFGLAIFSN